MATDIDNLLDTFLKNDRCIILAVMPANVHFSNTEIMQRALEVDPSTRRIIPVVSNYWLCNKHIFVDILIACVFL